MIATKNKSIKHNGIQYELFLSIQNAGHICQRYNSENDPGDHLSFVDIETVILNGIVSHRRNHLYYFIKELDGKLYKVVCYLINRRCVIKTGCICNPNEIH